MELTQPVFIFYIKCIISIYLVILNLIQNLLSFLILSFFFLFICEPKRKKKNKKEREKTHCFLRLRFAQPCFFMLAIVLRTRSQLAPTLTLTPLGRGILTNVSWAESPTYYLTKNATLTKRIIIVNERITSRALFERSEFALLSSNFTND